jgi:hypothetical protein
MTSRTGMEAEAISRLTDGVQPAAIRAILVQCLSGELAPSTAVSRMLSAGGASTVRAAIDDVTHRAATMSRASDRLVQDKVDELTQVFVEQAEGTNEADDAVAIQHDAPRARTPRPPESGNHERQVSS